MISAYDIVSKTGMSSWKLDRMISKNYYSSYLYAKKIIKGNFALGEFIINKKGEDCINDYVRSVIRDRFRFGEFKIVKKMLDKNYIKDILRYNHD